MAETAFVTGGSGSSAAGWCSGSSAKDFERGNVVGTRNVLAACEEAGVKRFVHCGTEAALMA